MLGLVKKALAKLEEARLSDKRILVGLSGGKDSLATLDLCLKVFQKEDVVCFNMFYIPDLQVQEEQLEYAKKRFGIKEILRIAGENFWQDFKSGIYGWEDMWKQDLPDVGRKLIFLKMVKDTGITNIACGVKKNDNLRIRQQWEQNKFYGGMIFPLWNWSASDVVKYNILNKIEISKQTKEGFRGVGIDPFDLMFIYKNYPEDFKKLEKFYPFIRAKIFQIEHYNLMLKKHFV